MYLTYIFSYFLVSLYLMIHNNLCSLSVLMTRIKIVFQYLKKKYLFLCVCVCVYKVSKVGDHNQG